MPRIARKNFISKFHHVIVQGINKEYIFKNSQYINTYKNIILKKLEKSDITILSYCIMNNHAHFLIYSANIENLSKFMQRINTSYSKYYNKENNRVGYVFRDRYYTQEILDKNQLYNCMRYIHNNPVKAGIVKNFSEYKYSSYNEFTGDGKIINSESIKLLFGTSKTYINQFNQIHKVFKEESFADVDKKEKSIKDFIIEEEKRYGKKIKDIKCEKKVVKEIVKKARVQTDVTIKELATIFEIPKSTIARYCKE